MGLPGDKYSALRLHSVFGATENGTKEQQKDDKKSIHDLSPARLMKSGTAEYYFPPVLQPESVAMRFSETLKIFNPQRRRTA
jgi:hypothetical protein